jgi:hypothetical protein
MLDSELLNFGNSIQLLLQDPNSQTTNLQGLIKLSLDYYRVQMIRDFG